MKQSLFILLLASTGFWACSPAQMAVNAHLDAEALSVKGRNGFRIGQTIRYGDFHTDKVRRGWTKGYDLPFYLRFRDAREKMSYTQFGPQGRQAEVACISRFHSVELPVVREYFSIPLDIDNFFAGNVSTGSDNWDFIVYNPNGDFLRRDASAGHLKRGDEIVEIRAVRSLEGQPRWMEPLAVYGHEFFLDGKVVAAVSTVNRGTVWIDADLDAERQTVIAAVATGLLLRTDVEQTDMRVSR